MSRRLSPRPTAAGPLSAPVGALDLMFRHHDEIAHVDDPIWQDVSSLTAIGRSLFCTCDETATVERLILSDDGARATHHVNFPMADFFDLPGGPTGEMDIEGLCIDGGYLWICASQALKRGKARDGLKAMETLEWDANRGFLGRVPLAEVAPGVWDLVPEAKGPGGEPLTAARARMGKKPGKAAARRACAGLPLLAPFVDLPCKENGLDVEGFAVRGSTVLLGLRGPALRGHAALVRMEMKSTKKGRLKPRKLKDGRRAAVQLLDLDGQGIRDMAFDGDRLLLLTGATTDLEALQSVRALGWDPEREIVPGEEIARALDLPIRRGADAAEGLAILDAPGGGRRLAIAYDSPHVDRTDPETQMLRADLFAMV